MRIKWGNILLLLVVVLLSLLWISGIGPAVVQLVMAMLMSLRVRSQIDPNFAAALLGLLLVLFVFIVLILRRKSS